MNLSEREHAICNLVAYGFSDQTIADGLGLSRHTIKDHLNNVYRKFGIHSENHRVRLARLILGHRDTIGVTHGPFQKSKPGVEEDKHP